MFLITTADQRFWKADEPVLFLGEWCKLFKEKAIWEKLSYEVLPYHLDVREKLYQDYLYLDKLYERVLLNLTECLNKIHKTNHNLRYWMIIIGPWLASFITVLYDRYQSILRAQELGKVTNTFLAKYEWGANTPEDFNVFLNRFLNDDFNHYLYTRIIEFTAKIPFQIPNIDQSENASSCSAKRKDLLTLFKDIGGQTIIFCQKLLPSRFNGITLVSSYLDTWDLFKLQVSLGQFPYLVPPKVKSPDSNIDRQIREVIFFEPAYNEFERLLLTVIKEQIPKIYLEAYSPMQQAAFCAYPQKPKVILTAVAYHTNEAFKFWAAHHVGKGVKLVGIQHGGFYGAGLWFSSEDHELRICDRFYTWGWKPENSTIAKPLPAIKLNAIILKAKPKRNGRLLMVLSALPRYFYHMYSVYISASGVLSYFEDQYNFVKSLSEENQKLLLVRLYQHDYEWSQKERWQEKFPKVECYSGPLPILSQLKQSRLCIVTYAGTSYLETLAANFPTILFWNPKHWELRPQAQSYFDQLRRAGILYDNSESAAAKVNEICDDPSLWWEQPNIQAARARFCGQFACISKDWSSVWKKELKRLESQSSPNY